ncbi:MAG: matrixin family metalloprotease [Actinomycetota bacterium]|jgi:hypothetical protein|nr:matrixin family metalloprotease [Actinomycetota bacterium]MEC9425987.1 matrixin family metalloprotease [Actinomycetota bacterium]MED5220033.1 matrixin family metalloprotease [Actinomycetota bacterium]MEE3352648.1 matrixin family metalloprotease [Actinomycetota bacterium]
MARNPADRRRLFKRISLLVACIVASLVLIAYLAGPEQEEPEIAVRYDLALDGKSWSTTIDEGNVRAELDWEAAKLLTLYSTGSGNFISELDLAGSNPAVSNRFGNLLWPQCTRITTEIFIDQDIPAATRSQMRDATISVLLSLKELTGLNVVVTKGASERGEEFSTAAQRISTPDDNTIAIHWVDKENTVMSPKELAAATMWATQQRGQQIPRTTRIRISSNLFDTVPDGEIDRMSRKMAIAHELSHAFGIGHSNDPGSYMYPMLALNASITPADRAALALTGSRTC